MKQKIAIAIETSCRAGGVGLGRADVLAGKVTFDASGRASTQLIQHLATLLAGAGLKPADIDEVYVSTGPGSFTGLRIGITAARTLAQALEHVRCVAVPTAHAVAQNAREMDWNNLGVVMDARNDSIHVTMFVRRNDKIVELTPGRTLKVEDFLAWPDLPHPMLLIGEGLTYHKLSGPGLSTSDPDNMELNLPNVEGLWRAGTSRAAAGQFIDYNHLLPIYARKPEAVSLWEKRNETSAVTNKFSTHRTQG